MSHEIRDIPGCPGYKATSEGDIIGKRGHVLTGSVSKRGGHRRVRIYGPEQPPNFTVDARHGGTVISCFADVYVHVLVARAFLGPAPFEGALVLHWDDDPWNNRPENLRYGTGADNWEDRRRNTGESVDDDGFDWATGEVVDGVRCLDGPD